MGNYMRNPQKLVSSLETAPANINSTKQICKDPYKLLRHWSAIHPHTSTQLPRPSFTSAESGCWSQSTPDLHLMTLSLASQQPLFSSYQRRSQFPIVPEYSRAQSKAIVPASIIIVAALLASTGQGHASNPFSSSRGHPSYFSPRMPSFLRNTT